MDPTRSISAGERMSPTARQKLTDRQRRRARLGRGRGPRRGHFSLPGAGYRAPIRRL